MSATKENEKLLDEMCERIVKIIDSRDIKSYQYLLNLMTLTIEAIAEMFTDVTAVELVNSIQKRIERDLQNGGDN